jgi:hypothetical protein
MKIFFLVSLLFSLSITSVVADIPYVFIAPSSAPAEFDYNTVGSSILQSWGDGRDVNGNWDGNAGFSDGDPVTTVDDKSANAVNFGNTSTARPTLETNEQNGKPCLKFDSAFSQSLNAASDDTEHSCIGECWFFMVIKFSSTNTGIRFMGGKDGTDNREWGMGIADLDGDSSRDDYFGFLWADDPATSGYEPEARSLFTASGQTQIMAVNFKIDGTPNANEQRIFRNGSEITTAYLNLGAGTGWPAENLDTPMSIGGRSALAASTGYLQNDLICQWLYFNGALTGGEQTTVWSELNNTWGVY